MGMNSPVVIQKPRDTFTRDLMGNIITGLIFNRIRHKQAMALSKDTREWEKQKLELAYKGEKEKAGFTPSPKGYDPNLDEVDRSGEGWQQGLFGNFWKQPDRSISTVPVEGAPEGTVAVTQPGAYGKPEVKSVVQPHKPSLPAADVQSYSVWKSENPNGTYTQYLKMKKGIEGSQALENKKAALRIAYPNASETQINKLAVGTIKTLANPITGQPDIVDLGGGSTRGGGQPTPPPSQEPSAPQMTIWGVAGDVAGPVSAGLAAGSKISGMVGGPIAKDTIQARQFVRAQFGELRRSLSMNPRFPIGEMERIESEIEISPNFFDNEKVYQERLKAIDRSMRMRLKNEEAAGEDPTLPAEDRGNARRAAKDLRNFIRTLGVPQGGGAAAPEDDALINKYLNRGQ